VAQRNGGHGRHDYARPDTGEREAALSNEQPVTFVIWATAPKPTSVRTYSDDMRDYWTPAIGTLLVDVAHRIARHLESTPVVTFTWPELAATFGLGGNLSSMRNALERLERHRFTQVVEGRYALRLTAPALNPNQQRKLPEYLAGPHPLTYADLDVNDLRDHHPRSSEPPRQTST